jgi:hypothetical protein
LKEFGFSDISYEYSPELSNPFSQRMNECAGIFEGAAVSPAVARIG